MTGECLLVVVIGIEAEVVVASQRTSVATTGHLSAAVEVVGTVFHVVEGCQRQEIPRRRRRGTQGPRGFPVVVGWWRRRT